MEKIGLSATTSSCRAPRDRGLHRCIGLLRRWLRSSPREICVADRQRVAADQAVQLNRWMQPFIARAQRCFIKLTSLRKLPVSLESSVSLRPRDDTLWLRPAFYATSYAIPTL